MVFIKNNDQFNIEEIAFEEENAEKREGIKSWGGGTLA
jgi:hypothetical protein